MKSKASLHLNDDSGQCYEQILLRIYSGVLRLIIDVEIKLLSNFLVKKVKAANCKKYCQRKRMLVVMLEVKSCACILPDMCFHF